MVGELLACPAARRLGWRVRSWPASAEAGRGANRSVVERLWAELTLLARARWAVVSCTSNMGKLVQMLRDAPADSLRSIDTKLGACAHPGFIGKMVVANAAAKAAFDAEQLRRNETARPWSAFMKGYGGVTV